MSAAVFHSANDSEVRVDSAELNRRKKRFGQRVRTLREAKEWTQEDLALQSGLSRSYISRLELGDIALPRNDKLGRLARALGTSNEDLLEAAGYMSASASDTDAALPDLAAYLRRKYGLTQPRLIATIQHIIDLAHAAQSYGNGNNPPADAKVKDGLFDEESRAIILLIFIITLLVLPSALSLRLA
jgi:transcriptional regulator with XRE-family HTH domain